jgi:hypothetical protein
MRSRLNAARCILNPKTLVLAWVGFLVAGLIVWFQYDTGAGELDAPPYQWPSESTLRLHPQKPTVILFLHPFCPCSQASLTEFSRLQRALADQAQWYVVFSQPGEMKTYWQTSPLWSKAQGMPSVKRVLDHQRLESRRFKVNTSGEVMLYTAAGKLRFYGGITPSRGHEGESVGQKRLISLVRSDSSLQERLEHPFQSFVFGCPLFKQEQKMRTVSAPM